MENEKTTFSQRLIEACNYAEIDPWGRQRTLAKKLNIKQPSVSKWLTGKGFPTTEKIIDIANVLGVSAEWLMTGKGPISEKDRYSSPQIQEIVTMLEEQSPKNQQRALEILKILFSS
ncbi:MAG TPA: helix-turn-helix domain-containing protein [Candidatus Aphodousia faecavium]|nr:helix-turn-helix domain-containing protein [Candidatus Aphodousia faecavium]